jgi:hypothetical protein
MKKPELTFEQRVAQGELYITRVASIPQGFGVVTTRGELIVGHSETGHHHVIRDGVTMFDAEPRDPSVCYLQVDDTLKGPAALEHLKSYAPVHPTVLLQPGAVYRVRRARQMTPSGWEMARD